MAKAYNRKAYNLEMAMKKPEEVEELSIVGLNLRRFPKEIFKLKRLKRLDLSGNKIDELPIQLNDLNQLMELRLGRNLLNDLSFAQFNISNLINLTALHLDGNSLTKIPQDVFNLTKLITLNLKNNKLREISPEILMLDKLRWLDLSKNLIHVLPEEFGELRSLLTLNLFRNELKYLPNNFCQLKELRELELSNNPIEKFPNNFSNLQSLINIQFDINGEFESSLLHEQLKSLQMLYISGNKFSQIPNEIFQLTNLKTLCISNFSSSKLPESIGNLKKLRDINISHIPLKSLPSSIGELTNLEGFSIFKTKIKYIPSSTLNLKKLRNLDATKNLRPKVVMRFLREIGRKKIPNHLKEAAYEYIFLKKNSLNILSKKDLLILTQFPFQNLGKVTTNLLYQKFSVNLKKNLLSKDVHIAILGKTNLNLKKVEPFLKNTTKKITSQTTHVVLGKLPNEIENLASRDFVFVRESELNRWLQTQEQPYLFESSVSEIESLSKLLRTFQLQNIDIALQILDSGGVPESILTDLVIVFKKLAPCKQKRAIRKLLAINLSEKALKVVTLKTGLLKKDNLTIKIRNLAQGTELDGEKIAAALDNF